MSILDTKNFYIYDIEVYPNLFTATFIPLHSETSRSFIIYKDKNFDHRKDLLQFLSNKKLILAGYNNEHYDNLIIDYLTIDNNKTDISIINKRLFELSKAIIDKDSPYKDELKQYKYYKHSYLSIDLMTLNRFHILGVGLKQVAVNLKHYLIQDLPLPFDKEVCDSDLALILKYNKNDVDITKKLCLKSKNAILLRDEIEREYNVKCYSADKSKIANIILESYYSSATGQKLKDFKDLRTNRKSIELSSIIDSKIDYLNPVLKNLLEEAKEHLLVGKYNPFKETTTWKYSKHLVIDNKEYDFGVGGLHSVDNPDIIVETDDYELIDADVASFYPNIMLNLEVVPKHLSRKFLDVLRMITEERLEAKDLWKTTKKFYYYVKQETLKITINAIFGKLNSKFYWLYDPKAMLKVTLNGQLYLLSLIDLLVKNGIEIVSANTDGITAKVRKHQKELYLTICKLWEERYNFKLEFTYYSKIIRRNVNNYLAVVKKDRLNKFIDIYKEIEEGSIKVKGWFDPDIHLEKGYRHPIITKAVTEYLLNGIHPLETLKSEKSVYEFLISQKTGSDFITEELNYVDRWFEKNKLQKNNRYFVSKSGSTIYKRKEGSDKHISLVANHTVQVLNNIDESKSISEYAIDYYWYNEESWKVLDEIQPRIMQLSFV